MNVSDTTWSMLRDLRTACAARDDCGDVLAIDGHRFSFVREPQDIDVANTAAVFAGSPVAIDNFAQYTLIEDRLYLAANPDADAGLVDVLRVYVPICAARSFSPERSFVVAHMAQSLDGKVATENDNSKWIGNEANLVHAHRLRALVDGVLVGGATARHDLPSLSVRHVNGKNPARIVLSDSFDRVGELPRVAGMDNVLVRCAANDAADEPGFRLLRYEGTPGSADIPALLQTLRDDGIQTVLLEGGPTTLRSFLAVEAVDWLQLHISPLLFGSGKPVLSLPAITDVDDAQRLRNSFYVEMDGDMMITGEL